MNVILKPDGSTPFGHRDHRPTLTIALLGMAVSTIAMITGTQAGAMPFCGLLFLALARLGW